jgi:hypothetical protein
MPEPIVMRLGMNIMPPEAISAVYFINHSHQQYQHCGLQNCIVLLTSLCTQTEILFLLIISDTQITVKGKQAISFSHNFLYFFQNKESRLERDTILRVNIGEVACDTNWVKLPQNREQEHTMLIFLLRCHVASLCFVLRRLNASGNSRPLMVILPQNPTETVLHTCLSTKILRTPT